MRTVIKHGGEEFEQFRGEGNCANGDSAASELLFQHAYQQQPRVDPEPEPGAVFFSSSW
jgi:hypothetical protein